MIVKEMIAEKVFAEGVAKDIRNFLPAKYENAEFQVMQMNKNNGVQMVGVQVRPVSYTHLDVYKSQISRGVNLLIPQTTVLHSLQR